MVNLIHEGLLQSASRSAEREAIKDHSVSVNYGDLAQAVLGFAGACASLGLKRQGVALAGVCVCRVIDRNVSEGQAFPVVDGGLHHHLTAALPMLFSYPNGKVGRDVSLPHIDSGLQHIERVRRADSSFGFSAERAGRHGALRPDDAAAVHTLP